MIEEIREYLEDTIMNALGKYLEIKPENIKIDSNLKEDLDVDSLDIVEIVMRMEDRFGITIKDEDAERLKTVRDLIYTVYEEMMKKNDKLIKEIEEAGKEKDEKIEKDSVHFVGWEEDKQPPLGVMPEFFFERMRIQDICRAIHEYVGETYQGDLLEVWTSELTSRIAKYNKLNKLVDKSLGKLKK